MTREMPIVIFEPENIRVEADSNSKILAVAIRNKINIRYGCGALRCGTCGIKINCEKGALSEITDDEQSMLNQLGLKASAGYRMACRAKILDGEVAANLDSQHDYDPGHA